MIGKNQAPYEAQEQSTLFQWARLMEGRYPELALMFAIPNGGSRHKLEAVNLKRQGVKKGVPDIFLPAVRGNWHGLFIELKRRKGGVVSVEQKAWGKDLAREGYVVATCPGADAAINIIQGYLKGEIVWQSSPTANTASLPRQNG